MSLVYMQIIPNLLFALLFILMEVSSLMEFSVLRNDHMSLAYIRANGLNLWTNTQELTCGLIHKSELHLIHTPLEVVHESVP